MFSTIRHPAFVMAGAIALGACGQQSGTTTITTNSETGATTTTTTGNPPSPAALGIKPGQWETTIDVVDYKVTGAPAGMPAMPKPERQTMSACVTPEMAAKNPIDAIKEAKLNCTISNSVFAGGKVASDATCKMPNGTITTSTTGTYSPTEISYDSNSTMAMGPLTAKTKTHTVSRRIGDCGPTKE